MEEFLAQLPPALQNIYVLAAMAVALLVLIVLLIRRLAAGTGGADARLEADEAAQTVVPVTGPGDGRPLSDLPGVSAANAERLMAAGVGDVEALLAATADADALHGLADALQLEDFVVRKWVNAAGLLALPNVTPALADALIRCGVRGREALAGENPDRVQHKLAAWEEKNATLDGAPDRRAVAALIEAAAAETGT